MGGWQMRRRFLEGLACSGFVASTAGCSRLLSNERRVTYGPVEMPDTETESGFTEWIPTRAALGFDTTSGIDFTGHLVVDASRLDSIVFDAGVDWYLGNRQAWLDYFGRGFWEFDRIVFIEDVAVVLDGAFDTGALETLVQSSGYMPDGSHRGFTLYRRSDIPRAVALSDSAVVFAMTDTVSDARRLVTTIVDANHGVTESVSSRADLFYERAGIYPLAGYGVGDATLLGLPGFDRVTPGQGFGRKDEYRHTAGVATFEGSVGYFRTVREYEPGATPTRQEVRNALNVYQLARRAEAVDVSFDDQFVSVTLELSESAYLDVVGVSGPVPLVTWGVDQPASQTLRIRHDGGESVSARNLTLSPDQLGSLSEYADEGQTILQSGSEVTVDLSSIEYPSSIQLHYASQTNAGRMFRYHPT